MEVNGFALIFIRLGIESGRSIVLARCLISFHSSINMEDLGYLTAASATLIALVSLYTYAWTQLAVTRSPPASNHRDTVRFDRGPIKGKQTFARILSLPP